MSSANEVQTQGLNLHVYLSSLYAHWWTNTQSYAHGYRLVYIQSWNGNELVTSTDLCVYKVLSCKLPGLCEKIKLVEKKNIMILNRIYKQQQQLTPCLNTQHWKTLSLQLLKTGTLYNCIKNRVPVHIWKYGQWKRSFCGLAVWATGLKWWKSFIAQSLHRFECPFYIFVKLKTFLKI